MKKKLAVINEKYGDSSSNKEDARWYYLAPMLMDGVIYAKNWIDDIVWEMNVDEEDTTSEVRSSSKDKRNKGFIAHIDKLRSYLDAPEEIYLGRKPDDPSGNIGKYGIRIAGNMLFFVQMEEAQPEQHHWQKCL